MTAAKIDALTACRWPDCTAAVHRRDLCVRHYDRAKRLVQEGAHWSDDPRVWAALWEDRSVRLKAARRERDLRNLHGTREACEGCKAPAVTSDSHGVPLCRACYESLDAAPEPDPRDQEIADLNRELTALRTVVREAFEAFERAHVIEGMTLPERVAVLASQRNLADHALADIGQRAAALGMPAGLHIGSWFASQLTEARGRAQEMEARALDGQARRAEAELAKVREHLSRWMAPERTAADMAAAAVAYVAEVEREGGHYARLCQAAHDALHAAQVPSGSTPDVRIVWLSDARGRAEADAFRLRAAIAGALNLDGAMPPDAELIRRLDALDDAQDLAVVRKVIGTCTTTIRKVVREEEDAVSIAVDGLCAVIETTVGVPDAR